jgi:hypothetical protein
LHAREALGVGRRLPLVVTHVNVNERRPGFESLVRGFDLLGDADRDRGVLRLLRQRSGDRDADDERRA